MTILLIHLFSIALVVGTSYWGFSSYIKDPTIGAIFMLLVAFLYTSVPLFEIDKLHQEVFGKHSGNLLDASPLIKEYQTLKMNLEACENKLAITQEQFSRYYKDLDIDFISAIQSINNNLIKTQETSSAEIVVHNPNYIFWGSGIILAIVICGISYYFLSNQPHQFFARIWETNNLETPLVYAQAIPHYPQMNNAQELAIDHVADFAVDRALLNIQVDILFDAFAQHADATHQNFERVVALTTATQQTMDQLLVAILG